MKAESINKIVFEELKGTNIIIDIKNNLIDRLMERERKLQSQLKERDKKTLREFAICKMAK